MDDGVTKLTALPRSAERSRVIRFLAVGALNTLFGYSLYALLLWIGLPLEFALLLCSVIGVLFNFVTYGRLAFGHKLTNQSLPRFIAAYVVFYFLNLYLARALIGQGFSAYVAQLFLLPWMAGGMFLTLRYLVYRQST